MKILQINKFLYPRGGAETYLMNLSQLLEDNGQSVVYFSQKNEKNIAQGQDKYFVSNLEMRKLSFSSLIRLPRIFWSWEAARKIKKLIKEEQPDLAHLHNIYHQLSPSILPAIKKQGLPMVMTVHDFKLIKHDYTLYADNKQRHKNNLLIDSLLRLEFAVHKFFKIYQKNIDIFIAPSHFVKNKLVANGFDSNKIVVISHFIDLNKFSVQKSRSANDKYILYFGRLDESKGIEDLISAYTKIADLGVKLKIAGGGPLEDSLKRLVEKLGLDRQVEFLGQKNPVELQAIISRCLFVAMPSKVHETFGLSVLEAFAYGKPVIAYKVGALGELINNNKNGYLVDVGDVSALAEKISYLIRHPKLINSFGLAAKATAKKYTPEEHLRKILALYAKLIKAKKNTSKKKNNKKPAGKKFFIAAVLLALIVLSLAFAKIFNLLESKSPMVKGDTQINGQFVLPNHQYPRLANLYWRTPVTREDATQLAKWDIVVLDMNAQSNSAENIRYLRQLNPSIVILAYTSANELPRERLSQVEPSGSGLWHDLASGAKSRWELKTYDGKNVVFWPGNIMMNLYVKDETGRTYSDYLAEFYKNKVLSTNLWDGILFDNIWQNVTWVNKNIDMNADGARESEDATNRLWQEGYNNFFKKMRENFGGRYLIIGNGDGLYHAQINGRMLEGFPEQWEGGWSGSIKKYAEVNANGYNPRTNIINSDTENTGAWTDWHRMRYGLTSALLYDGYFSFDYGTQLREQLWWYDEYDAKIGWPKNEPFNLLDRNNKQFKAGLWQRDFTNGIVIVNSTNQQQTINFDTEYEKIHGQQDKAVNNGEIISTLTIAANDGIILLRPLAEIKNASFINGSFARIFNASGQTKRTGFFAYDEKYQGGNIVIKNDINNDGQIETIVSNSTVITVYNYSGGKISSFAPYGSSYKGGISIALADINDNNQKEIITGPENGGANEIKIFTINGQTAAKSFYAYGKKWPKLGANVAVGDVNGDGKMEIITGSGKGGGPYVNIYDRGGKLTKGFFAHDKKFRGGVNVALGDINGDGRKEIIAGNGWGGSPLIKTFTDSGSLLSQWFAYDKTKRQGVKVTATDIDSDGKEEVIALTTDVFTNR